LYSKTLWFARTPNKLSGKPDDDDDDCDDDDGGDDDDDAGDVEEDEVEKRQTY